MDARDNAGFLFDGERRREEVKLSSTPRGMHLETKQFHARLELFFFCCRGSWSVEQGLGF